MESTRDETVFNPCHVNTMHEVRETSLVPFLTENNVVVVFQILRRVLRITDGLYSSCAHTEYDARDHLCSFLGMPTCLYEEISDT